MVGLTLTLLLLLLLLLLLVYFLLLHFLKMAMGWWVYIGVSRTDTSTIDHGNILKEDTHHTWKFSHFDFLTQTHTIFFDPLLEIWRFSGLELIQDHSVGLQTFWKMRPNVS